ncbi:MAG: TVP38/TMEM64 family protein [Spirulinaceae cyanobacterium RM2_2_10]|nr:TVP38/TMEM64 family protein [Spirulinaceae cyanobacterium SM2_1_0]NJO20338.1 TVP38/TMEM64 family protein [Spirulinaceae cyanobacterium RM2_2_10]
MNGSRPWHQDKRFWGLFALGLCLAIGLTLTPLRSLLIEPQFWVERLDALGYWAVKGFLFAYVVLTVLGMPGTILTLAGGAVFGLFWGTVWSVLGATAGAIAAFLTARYLLHDWVQHRFKHHRLLHCFCQAVRQQPLHFVLAVRLAPISPFNLVNFLFGLTPIGVGHYAIGTLIGIVPGTLAYTWVGTTGLTALAGGDRWPLFAALSLLALLSLLPLWGRQRLVAGRAGIFSSPKFYRWRLKLDRIFKKGGDTPHPEGYDDIQ